MNKETHGEEDDNTDPDASDLVETAFMAIH